MAEWLKVLVILSREHVLGSNLAWSIIRNIFLLFEHVHWATYFLARIGFGPAIFGPGWAQAPILTYVGPFLTNYSVIFA